MYEKLSVSPRSQGLPLRSFSGPRVIPGDARERKPKFVKQLFHLIQWYRLIWNSLIYRIVSTNQRRSSDEILARIEKQGMQICSCWCFMLKWWPCDRVLKYYEITSFLNKDRKYLSERVHRKVWDGPEVSPTSQINLISLVTNDLHILKQNCWNKSWTHAIQPTGWFHCNDDIITKSTINAVISDRV